MKYVVRLKRRDKNGRLLRSLGRHKNLQEAYEYAAKKYGRDNINSVRICNKSMNKLKGETK